LNSPTSILSQQFIGGESFVSKRKLSACYLNLVFLVARFVEIIAQQGEHRERTGQKIIHFNF